MNTLKHLQQHNPPWVHRIDNNQYLKPIENTFILDGNRMTSFREFHDEIATVLHFPNYYGRNFNALSDMLTDLSWLEVKSFLCLVKNGERLLCTETILDIDAFTGLLNEVGKEWSKPIEIGEWWDRPAVPFHWVFEVGPTNRQTPLLELPVINNKRTEPSDDQ